MTASRKSGPARGGLAVWIRRGFLRGASLLALASVVFPHGETAGAAAAEKKGVLRVCGDPNNMPFSNEKQDGIEKVLQGITDMLQVRAVCIK